jgi:hypothetical protein
MKAARPSLFLFVLSVVVLLFGPGIVQATIYNEVRLTYSEYNNENLWIGGNKIVWQGWDGSDYEIFCYDIVSGETTQITQNVLFNDLYPQTDGEFISWVQREVGADPWDDSSFYLHEIETGETILFVENQSGFSWDGGIVAWMAPTATAEQNELFLYDTSSGETLQITDDSLWDFWPRVHQGRVVWMSSEDESFTDIRILVYDLSTGGTVEAFSTEETLYGFDFRGNLISWWQETAVDGNGLYGKVYAHDLATGQTLVVKDTQTYYYRGFIYPTVGDTGILWAEGEWVTFDQWETRFLYWDSLSGQTRVIDDSRQSGYHIDYDYRHTQGNHVVWHGAIFGNDEIFHHDLATGLTTQVTHDIFTDAYPVVYEGTIVWQGYYPGSERYEIYMGVPCLDGDGDGYEAASCGGTDCDDSIPDVNPGMSEIPGNEIDDDCNPATPAYPEPANTIATSYGRTSLIGSGVFNEVALVLLPVGAIILLRILRRRG